MQNFPLFPEQASTISPQVDALYFFLVAVSAFFTLLIAFLVVYFAVKYRREQGRRAVQYEGSVPLEILWSVIPLAIAMMMFVWGAQVYVNMYRQPRGAMEVFGLGKQWMWKFQHMSGHSEINELHVPVGRPVKMTLISQDVIHSFYVPAFRVKMDVIPGRYSHVWFEATKPGRYHLFCAEYCGTQHSGMIGSVVALSPADFQAWLAGGRARGSLAAQGEKLFNDLACNTCHRADDQARGPNLENVYGHPVRLADGRTVLADDAYIRESILNPPAKLVAGFQPIMPTYQGQISEEGLVALVAYIRSLSDKGQEANGGSPATTPPPSPALTAPGTDGDAAPQAQPQGGQQPPAGRQGAQSPQGQQGQQPRRQQ